MDKLISLVMIVKNEEKVLRRCLESVRTLVDEIIIIDTGSTDTTKQIALDFTDQVYDFEWVNDFSAARNESIKYATGQWILWMDADEYLDSERTDELKQYLRTLDCSQPLGIILPIINLVEYQGKNQSGAVRSTAIRLFVNGKGLHFTRTIHEQVSSSNGSIVPVQYPSFFIYHTGYTAQTIKEKNKAQRNKGIFENMKDNGGLKSPYDWYTLGKEYLSSLDFKKALYYLEKAYKNTKPNMSYFSSCVINLIKVNNVLHRYKEVEELLQVALQHWGNWPDFHFLQGELFELCGFYKMAEAKYEETIRLAEERQAINPSYCLHSLEYGKLFPYERLAKLYYQRRDLPKTVYALSKLVNLDSKHYKALLQLAAILSQHEQDGSVISYFEKIYPLDQAVNRLILFRTFTLLGHVGLSQFYHSKCVEMNLTLSTEDTIRFAILTRNLSLFEDLYITEYEMTSEVGKLLLVAAITWSNSKYVSPLLRTEDQLTSDLIELSTALLNSEVVKPTLLIQDDTVLALLIELFILQSFDAYDQVVQQFSNRQLINQLSNYFYNQNRIDLALDYYSLLTNTDEIDASGYLNLAYLQLSEGDLKEGLEHLRNALRLKPDGLQLYGIWFEHNPDPKANELFKSQFVDRFPSMRSLSIIKAI